MNSDFVHGPAFYTELVVRLSLHGLMPYWRALQLDMIPIEIVREAAEAAARRHPSSYGRPPSEPVAPTLLHEVATRTSDGTAEGLRVWMESRNFDGLFHAIDFWAGWFSEHQHGRGIEGLDPGHSVRLTKLWRDRVVLASKAYKERMARDLPFAPMPDWDMGQHADHAICYFAAGRFATADIVAAMAREHRFIRHCQFMIEHVLPLPRAERDRWEQAVQAYWDDIHAPREPDPAFAEEDAMMAAIAEAMPQSSRAPSRIPPLEELF